MQRIAGEWWLAEGMATDPIRYDIDFAGQFDAL